jgi:hypothetical protein
MGVLGTILAVIVLGIVVSTPETRAAGREMVRPFGRVVGALTLIVWGAIFWFR